VWAILQATLGETSDGTWDGWTVISRQVWHSTDPTIIRQRDHIETEGDRAEVKTVGESSDVSQVTKGGSTEEEDGGEESVGRERHRKAT